MGGKGIKSRLFDSFKTIQANYGRWCRFSSEYVVPQPFYISKRYDRVMESEILFMAIRHMDWGGTQTVRKNKIEKGPQFERMGRRNTPGWKKRKKKNERWIAPTSNGRYEGTFWVDEEDGGIERMMAFPLLQSSLHFNCAHRNFAFPYKPRDWNRLEALRRMLTF